MRIALIDETTYAVFRDLSDAYEAKCAPMTGAKPDGSGHYSISTDPLDKNAEGLLLYEEEKVIGFAITTHTEEVFEVAEFYIDTPGEWHGTFLARALFERHRGLWRVKQLPNASEATNFWRKVISDYTDGKYKEYAMIDPKWGPVICQEFVT